MSRAKGTGTVVPITPSPAGRKRWRVAVTMADGRRVWRTAYSEREAERVRSKLVEMRELDLDPTRQTLGAWLRGWVDGLRRAKVQRMRPTTIDHYALVVERHIIPGLGSLKLAAVSPRRVQAWLDALDVAPGSVRHYHAVLRRALNVAVRQRLIPYNPADAVELPEADEDRSDPLTVAEARALLAATADDWLGPMWRLAIATGMRRGELLGLTWDAVGDGWVEIRGQLARVSPERGGDANGWGMVPTKSGRRVVRVAIDPTTVAVLEAHRRKMAEARTAEWAYHGHVFVTPDGKPWHGRVVLAEFHRACKRAKIGTHRIHDLRGTSATILRDLGVAEDARMARLGHSTTDMARHYAQASERQDREAADKLGEAMG